MAKLITYVMVTVGLILFIHMAMPTSPNTGTVMGQWGINMDNIQNFSSGFWVTLIGVTLISLGALAGIKLGIFGSTAPTVVARVAVATPLMKLVGDLIGIINLAPSTSWIKYLLLFLIAPLVVGYIMEIINWTTGGNA